jgi:predicted phosphodiesterase
MRIAIFSDLHGVEAGYKHVVRHAQQHNADQLLYLGDLGNDPALFAALHSGEIACTFGNWEVSGLNRLPSRWAKWVAGWPAKIELDDICFTHATPDMPATVTNTAEAAAYMAQGMTWHQLFPRLHLNEEARWSALAALETHKQRAAFHGHTHIQQMWSFRRGRWQSLYGPAEFVLEESTAEQPSRYLIGVGSAGAPQDGHLLRYALYDHYEEHRERSVQLVALDPTGK